VQIVYFTHFCVAQAPQGTASDAPRVQSEYKPRRLMFKDKISHYKQEIRHTWTT